MTPGWAQEPGPRLLGSAGPSGRSQLGCLQRQRSPGRAPVFAENIVYFDALEMPLSADLFFHCEKAY